jgi:CDP-diacylglycerol--glycerol-3-phosphate 3-phosphatidyltransferase
MASVYQLKPRFQALLRPLVGCLAGAGVTANQVTAAAALGSVGVGALVAWQATHRQVFLLVSLWLLVRMALNAIDGMLAREFGQQSRLGAYLNELGDIVSDAALYAPFALVAPFGAGWVLAVIVLAIMTECAGILGQTVGASRRYDGPLGKSDRAVLFGLLGLWIAVSTDLPAWAAWLMPLIAVALAATVANRVRAGLAEASGVLRQ